MFAIGFALLVAAPGCSATYDPDKLGGLDAAGGSGSTVDGGGEPGDGDGGGGGGNDGGGGDPPDGGGNPPPDAAPDCGDQGQTCCPPQDTDSCNDPFLECNDGDTCQTCGTGLDDPCCETEPLCSGALGLTCVLGLCTGL